MITLLIPSYNHENYIVDCLDAARSVDIPGRKILVVDDGSTDGTVGVVKEYMERLNDHSIELVCKKNSGLVSSLNLGLDAAVTEFFYLVASDDLPNAEGISKSVRELINNPDAKFIVGGGYAFYDDAPEKKLPVYGRAQDVFFRLPPESIARSLFLNYPSPLLLQSTVFRTEALRAIGGWDSNLVLDDYPTFVKMLLKYPLLNTDFFFAPEFCVVGYRQHSSNSYKNIRRQYSMVSAVIASLAPESIKVKAISRVLASYILSAIKVRDFSAIRAMLAASEPKYVLSALPAMIELLCRKICARFIA
jgi:glycosyltransferase involved in cell wall biosynthesis